MKMIFVALLVGNFTFLAFQLIGGRDPAAEVKPALSSRQDYGNLLTVAERDSKNKAGQKEFKKKVVEASSDPLSGGEKCQLVGPYAELLHAEYLVERLTALDVQSSIRHIEITDGKNYWVYSKPEMSEKEALRRLYEVQAKSIDDVYIIPTGELANGISFGQFSTAAEADERAAAVRAQGYSVEIKEIAKSHSEIWVEVHEQSEQKINEDRWLAFLKEEKSIERRQNYCLGVAN